MVFDLGTGKAFVAHWALLLHAQHKHVLEKCDNEEHEVSCFVYDKNENTPTQKTAHSQIYTAISPQAHARQKVFNLQKSRRHITELANTQLQATASTTDPAIERAKNQIVKTISYASKNVTHEVEM